MLKPNLTIVALLSFLLTPHFLFAEGSDAKLPQQIPANRKDAISSLWDRRAGAKAIDDLDGDGLLTENELTAYSTDPKL